MEKEMILLVHTSGHGFSIQKGLKKMGISSRLTPIPRSVSSDCGICLRFSPADAETVRSYTAALPFEVQGILSPDEYEE